MELSERGSGRIHTWLRDQSTANLYIIALLILSLLIFASFLPYIMDYYGLESALHNTEVCIATWCIILIILFWDRNKLLCIITGILSILSIIVSILYKYDTGIWEETGFAGVMVTILARTFYIVVLSFVILWKDRSRKVY